MKKILIYIFIMLCLQGNTQVFEKIRLMIESGDHALADRLLDSCYARNYFSDSVIYYRAISSLKQGELKTAKKHIRKLSKDFPRYEGLDYLKGLLSFSNLNYGKSIDHFSRFLKNNPSHVKALYNRAIALGMLEEYLAAIEDLGACIAIDPDFEQAYYSRAYWYEYTGNYSEAARDYEKSIRLNPSNFDAYIGLAFIQHGQNDLNGACETIRKAIEAGSQMAEELKYTYCK